MSKQFRVVYPGVLAGVFFLGLMASCRSGADPTIADIFEAAQCGGPEDIRAHLDKGADVDAKDEDGITPLMFAASRNTNPEAINVLIKAGADVNTKNDDGQTALDIALKNGNKAAVEILEKAGAK